MNQHVTGSLYIKRLREKIASRFFKFFCTVVGDYISIMKTTFDLIFDLYQAVKQQDTQKYGKKEKL